MKITTFGKNIKATDGIKDRVEEEFGKISRLVPDSANLKVSVSAVHNRNGACRAEATLAIDGDIIRAECESSNLYNSISEAADTLTRRIKKYNQRNRRFDNETIRSSQGSIPAAPDDDDEQDWPKISRVKNIDIEKVDREEAVARMDYLGHPFHLFIDAETNAPAVVYKRGDGSVGILLTAGEH